MHVVYYRNIQLPESISAEYLRSFKNRISLISAELFKYEKNLEKMVCFILLFMAVVKFSILFIHCENLETQVWRLLHHV